jgi:hypothetical protein
MTVKQLKSRIKRTEKSLEREREKNCGIISRTGWGAGMRKVRIGPSFSRETELAVRLKKYKEQLKKLEEIL